MAVGRKVPLADVHLAGRTAQACGAESLYPESVFGSSARRGSALLPGPQLLNKPKVQRGCCLLGNVSVML